MAELKGEKYRLKEAKLVKRHGRGKETGKAVDFLPFGVTLDFALDAAKGRLVLVWAQRAGQLDQLQWYALQGKRMQTLKKENEKEAKHDQPVKHQHRQQQYFTCLMLPASCPTANSCALSASGKEADTATVASAGASTLEKKERSASAERQSSATSTAAIGARMAPTRTDELTLSGNRSSRPACTRAEGSSMRNLLCAQRIKKQRTHARAYHSFWRHSARPQCACERNWPHTSQA